jgi:PAS domain S-box-containing protein
MRLVPKVISPPGRMHLEQENRKLEREIVARERFDEPTDAPLRRRVTIGFVVAVLLTLFIGVSSWRGARRAEQDGYWVSHTHEVMETIQRTSRHVLEAETSARAFALTGQEPLLAHYPATRDSIYQDEGTLRRLTADNLSQQRQLDVLGPQVNTAIEFADSIIAKRRKLQSYPGPADAIETERLIEVVRTTTRDMYAEEKRLLIERTQRAQAGQWFTRIIAILGALLGMGLWVLANVAVNREIDISSRARLQLSVLNAELEQRVDRRTAALQSEIAERKQAEEARERLAAVVECSDDAIISKSLDGMINTWNRGAERVFGYSASEMIGKSVLTLMPPDRLNEESDILTRIRNGGSVEHFETVRVRKDGNKIDVSVRISPIRDSSGVIVGASKIARDITERKLAEEALRESEERFHTMLDGIPQLAWTAEPDGYIFWFNQRWYDYTGTTAEQTKGWDWQGVHDPEILPKVLDRWKAAIADGTPFEMEFPLRAGDGKFGMFLTRVMPLKDANGRVVRWFGTNTDISQRKQSEVQLAVQAQELAHRAEELANSRRALEAQTLMLQSVLDSMGEGLIAADREGHFLIWNDAAKKLMGRDASDLPTDQWTPHYKVFLPDGITPCPPDRLPLVRALHGESVQMEMMVQQPGHTEGVFLEVSARPLKDNQGNSGGGVAVLRDITERKAAERQVRELNQTLEARVIERTAELKAANKELETFTYSVSHDLRAPLRHISGFTRIMVEKFGPSLPAEARQHLQLIEQGSTRMGQLVDELLKLARLGRQAVEVKVTELSSLVEDVVTLLAPETKGRQVDWKIQALPFVECDPILIRQVFQNLISNALKYSRPRSPAVIEIGQTKKEGENVIFVKDNGVGFEMKYADKLFGVFQRLHLAEEFEGTGIGLATVERIVKKHGGRVWVEAEQDRGATFYFTLGGGKHSVPERTTATAAGAR